MKVEGMNGISAEVIADSINDNGNRITTFELQYHRYIHSEFMTHRCLVGDTELIFDLPAGSNGGSKYRKYSMSIKEFCEKWNSGSAFHKAPRFKEIDTSNLVDDSSYSAKEMASRLTGVGATNIRTAIRKGACECLNPDKKRSEDYLLTKEQFEEWRSNAGGRKHSLKNRLSKMKIRMLDETSREVTHTNVTDCWYVGRKRVFKVITENGGSIIGTDDHPLLTDRGWVEIKDLHIGDSLVYVSNRKDLEDKVDPNIHKKINGQWVSSWNRDVLSEVSSRQGGSCMDCKIEDDLEIHHIEPVHESPEKAFQIDNVVALCKTCHKNRHKKQGWQEGSPLRPSHVKVTSIEGAGEEDVYDLSVASPYHNFVANNFVVHNCFSRNAASSRAVPTKKAVQHVRNNTAIPIYWGLNQSGMQAGEEHHSPKACEDAWRYIANEVCGAVQALDEENLHKQVAARPLEPFQMMKVVVTATEWDNFLWLRDDEMAQPEIAELARCIKKCLEDNEPKLLKPGHYHLPYISEESLESLGLEDAIKVSVSCCAQVSYRNLDFSLEKAQKIYDMLIHADKVHSSPFEHVATPMEIAEIKNFTGPTMAKVFAQDGVTHVNRDGKVWSGNFHGWIQHRQTLKDHTKWGN